MLQSAERLEDPEAQAEALCHLSEASFWSKDTERLETHVERVLALAEAHDLPGASAQGHLLLGLQRSCYGRLSEADPHLDLAEKHAREAKLGQVLARTLAWRSQLWYYRGDYERVLANFKPIEALGLQTHDAFTIMVSHFHTGLSQANAGNLAEALRVLENGRRLSERNNDLFWLGRYPNCVAWLRHEAFEYEAALQQNAEAAVIARQTGFLEGEANSIINVGLARLELGDLAGAREAFEKTEEVFKQDDWFKWRYRMRLEMGWSELALRKGDPAEARRHAESVHRLATGSQARKHLALALRQLGRIAILEERMSDAERDLLAAAKAVGDLQAPLAAWRVYAGLGALYDATGRRDRARTSYGTARQLLTMLAERAPLTLGPSILASEAFRDLDRRAGRA
jgi:tetratricopeptide (TPR) repeat protein